MRGHRSVSSWVTRESDSSKIPPVIKKTPERRTEVKVERESDGLLWTVLFLARCQGQTAKVPLFTWRLAWVMRVGVWRGGAACVSGPPGTPLPEEGRAYVFYLRKGLQLGQGSDIQRYGRSDRQEDIQTDWFDLISVSIKVTSRDFVWQL